MPTDDVIDLVELRQELIRPGGLWQKVDLVAGDRLDECRSGGPCQARRSPGHGADHRLSIGRSRPAGSYLDCATRLWHRDVHPGATGRYRSELAGPGCRCWRASQSATACGARLTCRRCSSGPTTCSLPSRKVCGILSERVDTCSGPACVVGIGINVGLAEDQLPVPSATSLAIAAQRARRACCPRERR